MSTTSFLDSLRATYPDLTSLHTASLWAEGLREPVDFSYVTATDVKAAAQAGGAGPCSIVLAGKIKAAADAARTADDNRAATETAVRTHVVGLRSNDAAVVLTSVDALVALGVDVLPHDPQNGVDPERALEFVALQPAAQRAAIVAGVYRGLALIPLVRLRPRKYDPRAPRSGELLQAGKDWRTGVEWGALPAVRLGLARWMLQHDMHGGVSDHALYADVVAFGPLSSNADNVRRARGVTDDALANLAEAEPSEAPRAPASTHGGGHATSPTARRDLSNLFLSLFSADELRRWLRYLPGGESLMGRLPGVNASPLSLASEAIAELERDGMIDETFWARLHEERPRRRSDIETVRRNWT